MLTPEDVVRTKDVFDAYDTKQVGFVSWDKFKAMATEAGFADVEFNTSHLKGGMSLAFFRRILEEGENAAIQPTDVEVEHYLSSMGVDGTEEEDMRKWRRKSMDRRKSHAAERDAEPDKEHQPSDSQHLSPTHAGMSKKLTQPHLTPSVPNDVEAYKLSFGTDDDSDAPLRMRGRVNSFITTGAFTPTGESGFADMSTTVHQGQTVNNKMLQGRRQSQVQILSRLSSVAVGHLKSVQQQALVVLSENTSVGASLDILNKNNVLAAPINAAHCNPKLMVLTSFGIMTFIVKQFLNGTACWDVYLEYNLGILMERRALDTCVDTNKVVLLEYTSKRNVLEVIMCLIDGSKEVPGNCHRVFFINGEGKLLFNVSRRDIIKLVVSDPSLLGPKGNLPLYDLTIETSPVLRLPSTASALDATIQLVQNPESEVVVLESPDGQIVSSFSPSYLVSINSKLLDQLQLPAMEFIEKYVKHHCIPKCKPDATLIEALAEMRASRHSFVIIVRDGVATSVISIGQLVQALVV
eukprot:PhF_6_TR8687/c0_g1_i1/m.13611